MESFFRKLKVERANQVEYSTRAQFQSGHRELDRGVLQLPSTAFLDWLSLAGQL